jgi:hypothetical protein
MMRVVREFPPSDSASQTVSRVKDSGLTLQDTSELRVSVGYMGRLQDQLRPEA